MKGIILLDNYFEDTEALATIDVLVRGGLEVLRVNMSNDKELTTQCGNKIVVDTFYKDVKLSDYDFLVIPGGKAVMNSLLNDKRVYDAIEVFNKHKKLIATICAAPALLRDYLVGKDYTCFPGFDKYINGNYKNTGVVRTDNYITARSMYYSIEFGLEIVKYLTNNTTLVERLKASNV
ncbi:MAG: DJ-1/PfpI family protein [Acholeplasmatales bacterium]|nr:DJ-1/PfpI family protein [Acholeplasmatales bacterium]